MKKTLAIATILTFTFSCAELDIENPNNADIARALQNPDDVVALAAGSFNTWFRGAHSYSGVALMLQTAADNYTCSWGNQAMRDMSWEPRKAFDNAPNYSYSGTTRYTFYRMYAAAGAANTVLKRADSGMQFGDNGSDNDLVKSFAKFVQGISLGYVGLIFDKGYVVTEDTPDDELANPVFDSYQALIDQAIISIDEAIAMATGKSFTVPATWLGGYELSASEFVKLMNTFGARILSGAPRNSTQNNAVNWAKVKTYATNGITDDFKVIGDGYVNWYSDLTWVQTGGWARIDMRVIHMMDPAQPEHWTDDPSFPHPPKSTTAAPGVDLRILSEADGGTEDYQYLSSNNFRTERGYYHFSAYRLTRYDDYIAEEQGDLMQMLKAENDLYLAEAEAHLGNVATAAAIVNAGTRVTRGGLAPVGAVLADVLDAIHHERNVELTSTGVGLQWFEMRKNNLLQTGSALHLPVPASILEILGEPRPFYTFGGTTGVAGEDYSAAGWR